MSHQVCPTVWTWSICRAAVFQAAGCQGVGCANGCEGDALVISVVPRYNLWLFNIAMENGPFIDDFPIKTSVDEGFSMAMLVITR